MKSVKVERKVLLEKIKKNRQKHHETFEKAWAGYRKKVIKELENNLEDARKGRKFNRHISLVEPINQIDDYDRVILMLELSEDSVIELSSHEFDCYVRDKWSWAQQFELTNSAYLA